MIKSALSVTFQKCLLARQALLHQVLIERLSSKASNKNTMSLSKDAMKLHFKMEGSVNGHCFEIQGVGEGKAFDGEHWSKLCVVKGKHLPFSFDILMPSMSYGTKQFAKYPAGMTDFFKAAVENGGLSWERTMTFEDGGYCTIVNTSELKDGSLHYHTMFHGINLKPDGPVMQKRTMGWLPSVETNIPRETLSSVTSTCSLKSTTAVFCAFSLRRSTGS
ncbi:red fluorescent protein drFP583 [Nematostella vectensis]|uniref:red fluorescent protein drFP583 n=1 Tax=Nematostella vectensis TaxID=45351 RepID=UPI00207742E8|nr:red fluorescent protein drFP583 [Nematostella vectensis]